VRGSAVLRRRLKVLLVDDHRLMLEAIRVALAREDDLDVVGETTSGATAANLVGQTGPDVVLLDVRMPDVDGLTVLEHLRERYPSVAVVMFSGIDDPALVRAALERGASAFVLKHVDPRDLAAAIRQVVNGAIFRPLDLLASVKQAASDEVGLSRRELSILDALQSGASNAEIAKQLFLAEQTVKFHLTNIYRKLAVSSRTEAVHAAYERGVLERPLSFVA
jgi:DNA-binding NarL/FixJ family response regulator